VRRAEPPSRAASPRQAQLRGRHPTITDTHEPGARDLSAAQEIARRTIWTASAARVQLVTGKEYAALRRWRRDVSSAAQPHRHESWVDLAESKVPGAGPSRRSRALRPGGEARLERAPADASTWWRLRVDDSRHPHFPIRKYPDPETIGCSWQCRFTGRRPELARARAAALALKGKTTSTARAAPRRSPPAVLPPCHSYGIARGPSSSEDIVAKALTPTSSATRSEYAQHHVLKRSSSSTRPSATSPWRLQHDHQPSALQGRAGSPDRARPRGVNRVLQP